LKNIEYTYNLNDLGSTSWTTSRSFDRYDYSPWDEDESFVGRLKSIKWKLDNWPDQYSGFVELGSGKSAPKAPKLPESYPKENLDMLFGLDGG
jgi:hypothetical protein